MPLQTLKTEIAIGVSSCLLHENVRYDGSNKLDNYIASILAAEFKLISFCPEVAIGMGIPRPPIQLVSQQGSLHALGKDDMTIDVTDEIQLVGESFSDSHQDICGYIFKSRSPSCGLTDTAIQTEHGEEFGSGLFASSIRKQLPFLRSSMKSALHYLKNGRVLSTTSGHLPDEGK